MIFISSETAYAIAY